MLKIFRCEVRGLWQMLRQFPQKFTMKSEHLVEQITVNHLATITQFG